MRTILADASIGPLHGLVEYGGRVPVVPSFPDPVRRPGAGRPVIPGPGLRNSRRSFDCCTLLIRTVRVTSFDLQPHLIGDLLELRPLRPDDWEALFAVASDPMIWEQHPTRDRYKEDVFREFFREALESGGAFVAVDRKTQAIIGSSRYFGHDPEKREIEIGWTFLGRSHWGGGYNREMKRLMLDHAFQFVESVVFMVGPGNLRSRRAVEKIGGVLTGRLNRANLHGQIVEHVVYQIKKPTVSAPEHVVVRPHA